MQLKAENISLLRKGCNSQILLLQEQQMQVVIKAVPQSCAKQMKHLQNEWTILSKLTHDNIVAVFRWAKEVTLPGKSGARGTWQSSGLHKKESAFSSRTTVNLLVGGSGAIAPAWDIKLDNILIIPHDQGVIAKLADFGFATVLHEGQRLSSFKGTRRGFMAPEIHACREDSSLDYDGKAADVFALGVVLFALVLGRLPFEFGVKTDKLYGLLAEGKTKEFWAAHTSALNKLANEDGTADEFQDLFENLVNISPQKRMSISEVLEHPWTIAARKRPLA